MFFYLIILYVIFYNSVLSRCFNFDTNYAQKFSINKELYFGYSVLLQNGNTPFVIVGAPKQDSKEQNGGSVFKCNILTGVCSKIKIVDDSIRAGQVGNWLGGSIDGDSSTNGNIYTCSPKSINAKKSGKTEDYYIYGKCYRIDSRNRTSIYYPLDKKSPTDSYRGIPYYSEGFAEAGLSVHYLEESKQVSLGAVGHLQWNGGVLLGLENPTIFPPRRTPSGDLLFSYLGYSVAANSFMRDRSIVWHVAGAPRNNNLLGKVVVFDFNSRSEIATFDGDEIGAYFGATLLVEDINGDRNKDLLVGAPMGAGETWDEGYVYCFTFVPPRTFTKQEKLVNAKGTGSRFGSAMSSLGDIDLDGFNDVAISAPYENNGEGVVYIYKGTINGLSNRYSQKLTASDSVKGFGLGISRGVDINNDGYNDIAIGAYKTNQVFIFKSKPILDYNLTINNNNTILKADSNNEFQIIYCSTFNSRIRKSQTNQINFKTRLILDKRSSSIAIEKNFTLTENVPHCERQQINFTVLSLGDFGIAPFNIYVQGEVLNSTVIGLGDNVSLKIPIAHACGDDNFCDTDLDLEVEMDRVNIIVEQTKTVSANITIENRGEPAYKTLLYITTPIGVDLKNELNCNKKSNKYECRINSVITTSKIIPVTFYVNKIDLNAEMLKFEFSALSTVLEPQTTLPTVDTTLTVLLVNSPYIAGFSNPGDLQIVEENTETELVHTFSIGNDGPSPLNLDVTLYVPTIIVDGVEIVNILEYMVNTENIGSFCTVKKETTRLPHLNTTVLNLPQNRTVMVNCQTVDCVEITCNNNFLFKFNNAKYTIKMSINSKKLVKMYEKELMTKDIIVFSTLAFLNGEMEPYWADSNTKLFYFNSKPVPLWIYIASIACGLLLVLLLTFLLYKCHFFERSFKNKLQEEKLMEEIDEQEQIFDKDECESVHI